MVNPTTSQLAAEKMRAAEEMRAAAAKMRAAVAKMLAAAAKMRAAAAKMRAAAAKMQAVSGAQQSTICWMACSFHTTGSVTESGIGSVFPSGSTHLQSHPFK